MATISASSSATTGCFFCVVTLHCNSKRAARRFAQQPASCTSVFSRICKQKKLLIIKKFKVTMKTIFKVVAQTPPQSVSRQDGTQTQKSTIVLQQFGGRYESSFACSMLGNMASCKFYANDIVFASLRFSHREYQGQYYMDATVQDIIKLNTNK